MWEYNNDTDESSILHNQFTAYLVTAVRRRKIQYLRSKILLQQYEVTLELQEQLISSLSETDMLLKLPLIDQLENIKLKHTLERIRERDLHILLAKALEDRSFVEIAAEIGVGYNTVASIYYRLIKRLRAELGVRMNDF